MGIYWREHRNNGQNTPFGSQDYITMGVEDLLQNDCEWSLNGPPVTTRKKSPHHQMQHTLVVLVVCVWLGSVRVRVQGESTRRYCGTDLSGALSLVCHGWYKRSQPQPDVHHQMLDEEEVNVDGLEQEEEEEASRSTLTLRRSSALSMLSSSSSSRDKRVGVVNECCYKPCSINELSQYCGPEDN